MSSKVIKGISEANNHLALNLHRLFAKEGGNVFFSPFSISTAMAMLFCGACNKTAQEIRQALGYDVANLKDEDVKVAFEQLLDELEKNPGDYTLNCANSLVSQIAVKEDYRTILTNNFKALLKEADFRRESAAVTQQINAWVSEKTNHKIPKLLQPLNPATVLVLLNAVYFKGNWLHMFDVKDTRRDKFYNNGKQSKKVDMMHMTQKFLFTQKDTYKALQLPYKGDDIAMLVLLPNKPDGLNNLEKSLSHSFIQDLTKSMFSQKVETALPKFKLEYTKNLIEPFKLLGVKRVFGKGADLGNMSASGDLFVSLILHKAVVEVNEEGSEAAAATAIVVARRSLPPPTPKFIVEHPFLFCIYNTKTNMILFMGRVNEL